MDRVNFLLNGNVDDLVNGKICLNWRAVWCSHFISLICLESVETEFILLAVKSDGSDSIFLAASENSDGNFSSVAAHQSFDWVWKVFDGALHESLLIDSLGIHFHLKSLISVKHLCGSCDTSAESKWAPLWDSGGKSMD